MKITRSALKNLIKEEMNRARTLNEVTDTETVHPLMPSEFGSYANQNLVWTMADLGELNYMGESITLYWPGPEGFNGAAVTIAFPLNDEERRGPQDQEYTGKRRNISGISGSAASSQIAFIIKESHPELYEMMKIADEGKHLIRSDEAVRDGDGWRHVAQAGRTMTSTGN
jgi:hypothetical protein